MLAKATADPQVLLRKVFLDRAEVWVLGLVALAAWLLPGTLINQWRAVPFSIVLLGVMTGAPLALHAMGIVLVHRSNRIINFAQAALGAFTGYLFVNFMTHYFFIYLYTQVAGNGDVSTNLALAPFGLQVANFVLSVIVSLAVAPLVGLLVYVLIHLFEKAPTLLVTVATIGISSAIGTSTRLLDNVWPGSLYRFTLPVDEVLQVGLNNYHLPELTGVVAVTAVGLGMALFLRFSAIGTVMRASSDNISRARTLGISVAAMNALTWVLAASLGGIAALVQAGGGVPTGGLSAPVLVRVLAVAVVARFASLPVVIGAAFLLGIVQQCLAWNLRSDAIFEGILLALIALFLVVRQEKGVRTDTESGAAWSAAREVRPIPAVLREFPIIKRYLRGLALTAAMVLLGLPWVIAPTQTDALTVAMIYSIVGISLLVLTGWAGQISLGQFAFAGVGAYVAAVLTARFQVPLPAAVLAGAISGAIMAVVVGLPALRLPGLQLAVVTLALGLATSSVLLNPSYLGKYLPLTLDRPGLLGLDTNDERVFYYFTLAILALTVVAVLGIRRSRTARALIAARDNEPAAQAFGINLFSARIQAFALSGFIAAAAGALFALQEHGVQPASYSADVSLNQFLYSVIGGLGSVWGPIIGQAYDVGTNLIQIPIVVALKAGVGVVVLLLIFPSGLGGLVFAVRDAILRRFAVRYRINVPSLLGDRPLDGRRARAEIAPKSRPGGGKAFVATRFRLLRQWSLPSEPAARVED